MYIWRLVDSKKILFSLGLWCLVSKPLVAEPTAYKVKGKAISVSDVYKENQGKFYELEKKKFELIEDIATEAFLDTYWKNLAAKEKTSVAQARSRYLSQNARVSEAEIKETLTRFKDHPRLKELSEKDKRQQITDYLKSSKTREAIDRIVRQALVSGDLVVSYPKPEEPIFKLPIFDTDQIKYGPNASDTKPVSCKGDDCLITVIEYSEYQCPFCVKVLPAISRLLTEYKGKVRWIVRDFPLGFHDRAKPAAVAAQCAADQGKYWHMYETLFKNQRKLGDSQLESYGKVIGLDMAKYKACLKNPGKERSAKLAIIDKNFKSGESVGVTGTPAFFINGRRLSGALPYEEFKRIFEEEVAKKKKS